MKVLFDFFRDVTDQILVNHGTDELYEPSFTFEVAIDSIADVLTERGYAVLTNEYWEKLTAIAEGQQEGTC